MNGIDKIKELTQDKAFVGGLLKNQTPEDAKAFLAEHGVDLSLEEVKAFGQQLGTLARAEGELSEAELVGIAGGTDIVDVLREISSDFANDQFEFGKEVDRVWDWIKSW